MSSLALPLVIVMFVSADANSHLPESRVADQTRPISAIAGSIPAAPTVGAQRQPGLATRKRSREAEMGLNDGSIAVVGCHITPPHKKVKGGESDGFVVAQSTRTRHSAAPRTPQEHDKTSKEEGCRVEALATSFVQGMSHQFWLGPSFQQEWTPILAQEDVSWIKGRAEGGIWQDSASVAQQDAGIYSAELNTPWGQAEDDLFQIPKHLNKVHRALLMATGTELAHGTIFQLRCRLCPELRFKGWSEFKRHSDTAEAHPLKIWFCERSGDFFARPDSLARHSKNPPRQCLDIAPEKAREKRQVTESEHEEFKKRLEQYQETGERIGKSFALIIKELYPHSSKKKSSEKRGHQ